MDSREQKPLTKADLDALKDAIGKAVTTVVAPRKGVHQPAHYTR